MAITIVSSVINSAASGANITLNLNSLQENDVVVTFGGFAGGTATAPGVISPSGYTSILVIDSAAHDFKIEWKRMGATVDPSVLLAGSGDAADAGAYGSYALRGVVTSGDPQDIGVQAITASADVPKSPSITTVTNGTIVLALAGNDQFDTSPGVVPNFNANMGASSNDTDDFSTAGAVSILATAGLINPSVWSTWASGNNTSATIAIKPEPAASGGNPFQSYVGAFSQIPKQYRNLRFT